MTVMKDEDIQKKGVVFVMYNYCRHREEVDFQREIHKLRAAMPYRTDAAHYCYDDASLRPFVAGIRLFIDPFARFRLRPHYGTPEQIEFELQTFGITSPVIQSFSSVGGIPILFDSTGNPTFETRSQPRFTGADGYVLLSRPFSTAICNYLNLTCR